MQKKTKSLLEELDSLYKEKNSAHVLENRIYNAIVSAIQILDEVETKYTPDETDNLKRKFLNAIKNKDATKFKNAFRKMNKKPVIR